jgi:hypothetical protein
MLMLHSVGQMRGTGWTAEASPRYTRMRVVEALGDCKFGLIAAQQGMNMRDDHSVQMPTMTR